MTSRRILFIVGLLFCSTAMQGTYTVGGLDTTADGGTGFGSLTPSSAPGYVTAGFSTNAFINASAIQPDGKIVVVGGDSTQHFALIARYNINGTEDTTFNGFYSTFSVTGATSTTAYGVTVLPNGKIVVVGQVVISGLTQFFVAQFLPNGQLDISGFNNPYGFVAQNVDFATGFESVDIAHAVVVDTAGNIYVVGTSNDTAASGSINIFAARYSSNGTLDINYNSDGSTTGQGGIGYTQPGIALISIFSNTLAGNGAALAPSGKLVVVGSTSASTAMFIAQLTVGTGPNSGQLDPGFNSNGYNTLDLGGTDVAYGVGFQSTHKIVVSGTDGSNFAVARFTSSGVLDSYANDSSAPFGTGGATHQTGYNSSQFSGIGNGGIAIQADDTIVVSGKVTIGGPATLFMIASFLADGSGANTSFNTYGFNDTAIPSGNTHNNGNSLSLQQNGSFVVGGTYFRTTPTTNQEFATARFLGTQLVQGAMDYSYNRAVSSSPGAPGFSLYPPDTDNTSSDRPEVVAMYPLSGTSAGDLYVLTQKTGNSQIVELAIGGGNQASSASIGQIGGVDVIADSQNRAVCIGANGKYGWIGRYVNNFGNMTKDTTFNSNAVKVETANSSSFQRVAEQSTGRLVVIGQATTSTTGLLIAYNENGILADHNQSLCTPFGTGGAGAQIGYNITSLGASTAFKDILIDAQDAIYIAYIDLTRNAIKIAKFLANGSGLSTADFGTGGIIDTGLYLSTYGSPSIAFDMSGNILLAVAAVGSGNIALLQITNSATPTISSNILAQSLTLLSVTGTNLTKLQCDTNNRLIFNGYDTNDFFIGRCGPGVLILDTTFAPYSSCPGIMKTMYSTNNSSRVSNSMCISAYTAGGSGVSSNGAILFGGYEIIDASDTVSLVGQAVGWTSGTVYTQVNRFPGPVFSGTLNTSYGTNGAKDLGTTLSIPAGQIKAINTITTGAQAGKILIADSNGSGGTTKIVILNATGTAVDSSAFGGAGTVVLNMPLAAAIMVDPTGTNYYVLGTNGSVYGITYGSATATQFHASAVTTAYAITQQASGRILVAGKDVTNSGVIVAYTPAGVIDTSFNPLGLGGATPNVAGYWYLGLTNPITAISVGATNNAQLDADKIFFAYDNGAGAAVVARLLENGTELDPNFTFGTAIASVSDAAQIKMQLNATGQIVLVANTGGTAGIKAARYASSGTDNAGGTTMIANTSGQVLENILCLSDGTTLILAAVPNPTPSSAFMNLARLTQSPFALDTTFNPLGTTPGILSTNVPSSSAVMEDYYALDVIAAGGILVSGDNNPVAASADPFLAEVVNTSVVTKVSQSATAFGAAGILDTTFNAAGTNAGFMNLTSELQITDFLAGTPAQVLLQLPNGTNYYVAGSTGSNTYVTQMSDDDVQVPGWAGHGLLTIGAGNVGCMLYGQNGGLYVAGGSGSSGSHAGWILEYSAADGSLNTGFNAPYGGGSVALDAYYAIAQQSNGRILIAGSNGGVGAIIAFNSVTGAVDTTFGVNGIYTLSAGNGAIYSMIVGANDTIYFTTTNSSTLSVKQLSANGAGALISGRSSLSSIDPTSTRVAFDQNNNIIAVSVSSTQVIFARFDGVNISRTMLVTPKTFTITGITTPHVTSMLVDLNASPGKVVITGYDSSTSPNTPFIARIVSGLTGLDTTFNNPTGVVTTQTVSGGVTTQWNAGMINADGKITVAGYASVLTDAYLMRVYGDEFMGQYLPSVAAGVPGTINTNFGISGYVAIGGGSIPAASVPQVVLPASNGAQYVAFASGDRHSASTVARYTNANVLDTSYHTTGVAVNSPAGLYSITFLANGGLLVAGTDLFNGLGWVEQYTTSGILDVTFNPTAAGHPVTPYGLATQGIFAIPGSTTATVAVQQSLSRIVVAGQMTGGHGALFGITNTGVMDATFAVGSASTGVYDTGVATTIYAMVADQYDRLIFAYKNGSTIYLRRLTSSGEVDTTFGNGSTGTITTGISTADSQAQVRIALDQADNIVVAAHSSSTPAIAIWAYANTTGTNTIYGWASGISSLTSPTLTGLIATADGKVLVSGDQSGSNNMWVARITSGGNLDTTTFNPNATAGSIVGIMQFNAGSSGTVTSRALNSIAIYGDGEISMVGTENNGSNNPFMARAYDTPYTTQQPLDLMASAPGINDATFGVTTHVLNGITFFATSTDVDASCNQVARAVVMQNGNDNGVVVALDGLAQSGSSGRSIFINMFDVDGLLNPHFNPSATGFLAPGQAVVLSDSSNYSNQYVKDMLTFTVGGVSKAILAGYATNTTPSLTGSLLIQYILTAASPGLDPSFGGFNGNYAGVAFGDGLSLQTVGLQSNSRIIGAGFDQSGNGLLLGYTAAGNLDQSFGQGGTFVQGSTGIYTSAIDSQDRVVIAYTVGSTVTLARILADGSGLDTSFNYPNGFVTTPITTAINSSNLRLALDGSGNIAVVSVLTGGTTFAIARYTSAGALSTAVNTVGGTMSLTNFTITKLLVDANGAVVVVGFDLASSQVVVVARLVYSSTQYILDTTFNASAGFVKYAVYNTGDRQQTVGAFIHPDGRIIVGGSQH